MSGGPPTYLPTCLPTYLPASLPAYLIYLSTYIYGPWLHRSIHRYHWKEPYLSISISAVELKKRPYFYPYTPFSILHPDWDK